MALCIAAIGEVTEDCYLGDDGHQLRLAGGISANFARSAAAAGAEVMLFAPVGNDAAGQRVIAGLTVPHQIRVLSGETAEQKIRLRADGERQFCGFRPGVLPDYRLSDDERRRIDTQFDVVHVPMQPETEHLLAGITRPARVADFSVDSATGDDPRRWCEPHLEALSVAFVGGHVRHLEALATIQTRAVIVLTCGALGAYGIWRGKVVHQPALPTHVVDTTGCGDAFAGAFTVAHFGGASLETALLRGAERAARVAERMGAG
ncbi:MAG: hypothetical protein IT377_10895 [Polyangiaceae bacterium]|nr:hypothetical protein [Polyangiaceae bacterium]